MTRGNQREQDRLKAQKKAAANAKKPKESATNLAKRKEADAEILRAKQKVHYCFYVDVRFGSCLYAIPL
ncbi:hypothetical protein BYT27DRAFT_7189256 [Phlegmacium glaucopus]|nr:hypothetical protein BYT27DRAFT_7189256 [Phlegmacium glaucopus]